MGDHRSCAAFYLPMSEVEPQAWAMEQVATLGVRVHPDPYGDLLTEWGGRVCAVEVVEEAPYRVLALLFDQYRLAASLRDNSPDVRADGAIGLATAFREACLALRPEVAFVASQQLHDPPAELRAYADDVKHHDMLSLTGSGLGLVYLRDPAPSLDDALAVRPRDELPVAQGRLVFAGKGPNRWWG